MNGPESVKVLGSAGALAAAEAPLLNAFAGTPQTSDEFYIFVHALGGWDVTLGADPRWEKSGLVMPASILFGAAFLIACDLVARTLFAPLEMPVGVITALVGGPFFLWLLVRSSR